MSTILQAGKMYQPSDISIDEPSNSAYIVEHLNHRISKWDYDPGAGDPATFVFTLDAGRITKITVDPSGGGTGYRALDELVISPPSIDIDLPVQATGEVKTVSSGVITELEVTNVGNGYDNNNLLTITAPTNGTEASLTAVVSTPWGTNRNGTTGQVGPATDGGPTDVFFDHPTSIANDGTRLYVTDTFHDRIRTLNLSTGNFISSASQTGTGDVDLNRPTGLDIHEENNFFVVADELNHRAVKYLTGDTPVFSSILDNQGSVPFNRPHGVSHNHLTAPLSFLISDLQGIITIFDHISLAFESQIGVPSADPTVPNNLYRPGSGRDDDILTVIVANTGNSLLKTVGATINDITPQPGEGTTLGKLYQPQSTFHYAGNPQRYLLVANTLNNRIEVFTGTFFNPKNQFGSPIPVLP